MVSNRKLKFISGERVLCYEPDPTKAKVLYDSKVLDVITNKDSRGKKTYEYLIHFQGWNSSWDRVVGEEFVLKDTPENRQLQKDLAEKSQLQLGAYLYRKERKKHRNKQPTDRPPAASSEDGSSGSPARMDTDEMQEEVEESSTSEEDSSAEEESIHIDLTSVLREHLEKDHQMINEKHKLVKLPADLTVVAILENYYKHYATNQICGLNEKQSKYRSFSNQSNKCKPEDIHRNLTICREVMDGLRIYFDFTVNDLLLYKSERGQIQTKQAVFPPIDVKAEIKTECQSPEHSEDTGNNQNGAGGSHQNEAKLLSISRRRTLRSNRSDSLTNGQSTSAAVIESPITPKSVPSVGSSNSDNGPLAKALAWRLLPDHVYLQQPPPPCLVYGAVHLTRLLVRLPDLLAATNMAENKLKTLLQHLDLFIDYLTEHKEWYGDKFYVDRV